METIEVTIYILLAVILGGLLVGFLMHWDVQRTTDEVTRIVQPGPPAGLVRLTVATFPSFVKDTWVGCAYGARPQEVTVFVAGNGTMDATALFTVVQANGWCADLQSASIGCGSREDVKLQSFTPPAVVTLRCDPASRQLIIS